MSHSTHNRSFTWFRWSNTSDFSRCVF